MIKRFQRTNNTTKSSRSRMLTSCPLALANILFIVWDIVFCLFLLGCLIYKGVRLIYPVYMFIIEIILIIAYAFVAFLVFTVTKIGNFKERVSPLIIAIIIALILCVSHVYFIRLQVYVLLAEVIVTSISIVVKIVQMILLGIVAISFFRKMY